MRYQTAQGWQGTIEVRGGVNVQNGDPTETGQVGSIYQQPPAAS